jgi:hypothetical protein
VSVIAYKADRSMRFRYRLATAHDANGLFGGGTRDQFAQIRLRLGEIDLLHTRASWP